jgi:PEGA domain
MNQNPFIITETLLLFSGFLLLASGQTGRLSVTSQPSGALVRIDDGDIGSTPIDEYRVKAGSHTLQLTDPGTNKTVVQVIQIAADSLVSIHMLLGGDHGFLNVKCLPKGATAGLYTKLGATPLSNVQLISGDYTLRVSPRTALYQPVDTPITIPPDLSTSIEVKLPKNPRFLVKIGVETLLGLAGIGAYGWGCSSFAHRDNIDGITGFCLGTACVLGIVVISVF